MHNTSFSDICNWYKKRTHGKKTAQELFWGLVSKRVKSVYTRLLTNLCTVRYKINRYLHFWTNCFKYFKIFQLQSLPTALKCEILIWSINEKIVLFHWFFSSYYQWKVNTYVVRCRSSIFSVLICSGKRTQWNPMILIIVILSLLFKLVRN